MIQPLKKLIGKDIKWRVWLILRFVFYSILFALLRRGNHSNNELIIGLTSGILYADFITWFLRKLLILAFDRESIFEGIANISLGYLLIRIYGIVIPIGEGLAVAFVSFMLIAAIKVTIFLLSDVAQGKL